MKNLFKNTFRNLKNSKVTMVALSFLVFLAIGIFTLLSSTTKNITNTYDDISQKGNMHDFTVSEQYSLGNTDYAVYAFDGQHPDGGSADDEFFGTSSDGKTIP
jgi:putative ABC transport system permease protein